MTLIIYPLPLVHNQTITTMKKYTTQALDKDQSLVFSFQPINSFLEAYMIGFSGKKRDKSLDGYYIKSELKATN